MTEIDQLDIARLSDVPTILLKIEETKTDEDFQCEFQRN
jgi:hypothetical protein